MKYLNTIKRNNMGFIRMKIAGDIIDDVEVTITKKHLTIISILDGMVVEKYHNYIPLVNKYHLKDYICELTEGSNKGIELYDYIIDKIK